MKLFIPSTMETIFLSFSNNFSKPTRENFMLLCVGAIITHGKKTITNILRSIESMRTKHFGTYHRFLSRAIYSLLPLARILCSLIIPYMPNTITIIVDEKLTQHKGAHVYGRGIYRDNRNTSRKRSHSIYGHKWLVFCLSMHMPLCSRPWALPIMVFFCPGKKAAAYMNEPYRSIADICIFTLKTMHRWFPDRSFKLVGDGVFAMFKIIAFCAQNQQWCTLVSRLRSNADLFNEPVNTDIKRHGRPRLRGTSLPSPKDIQADPTTSWISTWVIWYGNTRCKIRFTAFQALMYQAGTGVVPLLCVVTDRTDSVSGRTESFFTTDLHQLPRCVIQDFIGRWSIEVTFEEATAHLGIESTRNYSKLSVLRSFPLLLGLFTLVSLWYYRYGYTATTPVQQWDWYVKEEPTFADALYTMRQHFWNENIISNSSFEDNFVKIGYSLLTSLCEQVCRAA